MENSKIEKAKELIARTLLDGHIMLNSYSSGKDSSCTLNLVLTTLTSLVEAGHDVPPLFVINADTMLENPEMAAHTHREIANIKAYVAKHNLNVHVEISTPNLLSQWAVKTISGRNLPVFANKGSRDCTVDLKSKPLDTLKNNLTKQINKHYGHYKKPVSCIGTRYLESTGRMRRMSERGEIPDGIWVEPKSKNLMLSPIADWTDTDLWQYLYACSRGEIESYSDFSSLIDIYMAGTSETVCMDGIERPDCRFGCAICCVGRDKSLEAMLAKGGRYAYMQPLYDLQRFLVATQHDLSLRQWVGRSITDGYLAIGPDVYSPEMLANLLRYCLSIDANEMEAAYQLGIEPRFQLVTSEALIAIDAHWSQQGVHRAFHGLEIYRDIYVNGNRYPVPQVEAGKPTKIPEARYIEVGAGWEDRSGKYEYCGMRDVNLEMVNEQNFGGGCIGHKVLKDGRTVLDSESSKEAFTINEESVEFILGFELDYLIDLGYRMPRNYGYKHYITLGAFDLHSSMFVSTDDIIRRTAFKEFEGIFEMSTDELLELTISASEMRQNVSQGINKGKVGGCYQPGERLSTVTDRATKPYPKKPKDINKWFIESAFTEARLRKDKKAQDLFKKAKKEMLPTDAEIAEHYLFGKQALEQETTKIRRTAKIIALPRPAINTQQTKRENPADWMQLPLLAA